MCRVCYRRCSLRRQGAETIQSQYLLTLLIHAVSFPAGRGSESFVHSLIFMLLDLCANAQRFLLLGVPTPKHPQLKGFLPSKDKSFSKKYTKCKWIGGTECVERMIPILRERSFERIHLFSTGLWSLDPGKDQYWFASSYVHALTFLSILLNGFKSRDQIRELTLTLTGLRPTQT